MEMDPLLWRNLPEHVLDVILIHLPVAALTRFRCVCKRLNSLLSCRSFLVKYSLTRSPVSFSQPWLVHTQGADLKAWSFERNNWIELSSSWMRVPWFASVLASASGLVVMAPVSKGLGRPARIRVLNPFMGIERLLPPIGHPAAAQLVVDSSGGRYHVYALCEAVERGKGSLSRFASQSNSWEVLSSEPPWQVFLPGATIDVCNGVVYCRAGFRTPQSGIWTFDVDLRIWSRIPLAFLPSDARCQLVSCGNRVMLITRMNCDGFLRILQLDHACMEWMTILELPNEMITQDDGGSISCMAQGDLFFIVSRTMRDIRVAVFDLVMQRVQYAPPLAGALTTSKSFPFYPCLSTLV
ncbi:hypothetical protein M758_9G069400 [Ceratodon purpureus]|nr:hypothetical protein M758_9G069400 [Ceratodon purpureus]